MNQRIRELAEQAYVTTLTTKGHEFVVDGCYIVSPDKLEKFAELIVKETLEVARAGIEFGDGMEDAVYRYFGVEE